MTVKSGGSSMVIRRQKYYRCEPIGSARVEGVSGECQNGSNQTGLDFEGCGAGGGIFIPTISSKKSSVGCVAKSTGVVSSPRCFYRIRMDRMTYIRVAGDTAR
jgi:hypothetical protein